MTDLNLPVVTSGQDQKFQSSNDADAGIDNAITATIDHDFTSGNVTITNAEFRENFEHNATNLTVARNLTLPATLIRRFFMVNNGGSAALSVIRGSTTIIVDPTSVGLFYTDGTTNGLDKVGGTAAGVTLVDWKDSVLCATIVAGTLSSDFENGDTVDGVTLSTGDRILIKDQAAGAENGVYTVNASSSPTRADDFDDDAEVTTGAAVYVEEGDINKERIFVLITTGTITVGSTALVFAGIRTPSPYDFGFQFGAEPSTTTIIQRVQISRDITIPADMLDSTGSVQTNPASSYAIDVQDDGVSIGTITISTGGAFTFVTTSNTKKDVVAGSVLTFVTPGSMDNTIVGVAVGIIAF